MYININKYVLIYLYESRSKHPWTKNSKQNIFIYKLIGFKLLQLSLNNKYIIHYFSMNKNTTYVHLGFYF